MNRFLPAALVLALTTFAGAQQAPAPIERQAPASADAQPMPPRHQPNPQKQAKHLAKALNLTADQQSKIEPILADRDQKLAALQSDSNLDPKSMHKQMRAIHTATEQQLATILTPDQLNQMRAMKHNGHGHKGNVEPLNQTTPQA